MPLVVGSMAPRISLPAFLLQRQNLPQFAHNKSKGTIRQTGAVEFYLRVFLIMNPEGETDASTEGKIQLAMISILAQGTRHHSSNLHTCSLNDSYSACFEKNLVVEALSARG